MLKDLTIYTVDAFTKELFGGNVAGVVPNASNLTDDMMQKIAQEINASETAFLIPLDDKKIHFRIRYFSPTSEVDFCGHATLAASWILATEYGWHLKTNPLILKTNIGIVPIMWKLNSKDLESIMMKQVEPKVKEVTIHQEELGQLLGLKQSDFDLRYPFRLAYTGNWHLIVPINTKQAIDTAQPDFKLLKELNQKLGVITTHLFTLESQDAKYFTYTRDFAPAVGIDEDPVTGSANGALTGYFIHEGILSKEEHHLLYAQGNALNRPGELVIHTTLVDDQVAIEVGGLAVTAIKGILTLNCN